RHHGHAGRHRDGELHEGACAVDRLLVRHRPDGAPRAAHRPGGGRDLPRPHARDDRPRRAHQPHRPAADLLDAPGRAGPGPPPLTVRLPGLLLAALVAAGPAAAAPPGAAPTPEARERLVAAVAAYRATQYPVAARQFGEAADGAGPIAEYALYLQADSLARAGDATAAHAAAVRAAERAGEGPLVGPALQ